MSKPGFMERWKQKAGELTIQTYALALAYRDPRVPWYAKVLVALVVFYAFSPIDLIPDFLPVVGYLDDLVLLPLGVFIVVRMIPAQVMEECRTKSREHLAEGKPRFAWVGLIIIGIWILTALFLAWMLARTIRNFLL